MERRNKTNEFLKECIADALIKLMQEKPLETISITEITGLAGVGRSTYYRNFSSKEDILSFKLHLLARRWLSVEQVTADMDIRTVLEKACHYLYSVRELLDIYYRNDQIHMVCSTLYDIVGPDNADSKEDRYLKSSISFSTFGIIFQWLTDGMQENADELARIILHTARDVIERYTSIS